MKMGEWGEWPVRRPDRAELFDERTGAIPRRLGYGLLGLSLLALAAVAQANSGGQWYDSPCDNPHTGGGGAYIGQCESGSDDANDNVVSLDGDMGHDATQVIGGYSESGNANSNTVQITGGTILGIGEDGFPAAGGVYSGYSHTGDARDNRLTISGGRIGSDEPGSPLVSIIGGYAGTSGQALSNQVTISGNVRIYNANITGGKSKSGPANENTVTITGGTFEYVNPDTGSGGGRIIGGQGQGAKLNTVTISQGHMWLVLGGRSDSDQPASLNTVTISGEAQIDKSVAGGVSDEGPANLNHVVIKGGTVGYENSDHILLGSPVAGGVGTGAQANTVTISDGRMGSVLGGFSQGNQAAADNIVTISGGEIDRTPSFLPFAIAGGANTGNGGAIDNQVIISGGTIHGDVMGGISMNGATHGNTVQITGGTINGDVYGGWASGPSRGVSNDTIIIGRDAIIHGNVIGGFSQEGDSKGNRVILKGHPSFDATTMIRGGQTGSEGSTVAGNVLEVHTKG